MFCNVLEFSQTYCKIAHVFAHKRRRHKNPSQGGPLSVLAQAIALSSCRQHCIRISQALLLIVRSKGFGDAGRNSEVDDAR